ncbi:LysR family transcriptional regulator [Bradyrhizobium liaoningense]
MNSVALKYFHEVARSGSIASACERLHVASSAVSRKIAALEHEVGARLFDRQPRGMVLTDAGQKLAEHVKLSMLEERRVLSDIRNTSQQTAGIIKIATSQGLASHFVPEAARLYRLRERDVRFQVQAFSSTRITAAVIDGDADLAVAHAVGRDDRLMVRHRVIVPTYVVLSPKHPLGKRRRIELEELSRFPVARSSDTIIGEVISRRAAVQGIDLDLAYESNYRDGPFGYCSRSDAVTFASSVCAANWVARGELVAIPFANPELFECSIEVLTLTGRKLPSYVDALIDFLVARLPALQAAGSLVSKLA